MTKFARTSGPGGLRSLWMLSSLLGFQSRVSGFELGGPKARSCGSRLLGLKDYRLQGLWV